MEDFRLVMNYVFSLLSIEIPIFGYRFSIFSIVIAFAIMSVVIGFIVKVFGGDD